MLAMEAERFGGPQVLTARRVPHPVAAPGQVVVRTSAADVLFVDTFIRAGRAADFFPIRPPYVPGNRVAGQVISLGWSAFEIIAPGGRFSAHGMSGGGFAPLDQAEARRRAAQPGHRAGVSAGRD